MKLRSAVLCALSVGIAAAADSALTQVRAVYLLPMNSGLDQFLANRLTASGRYQVVTDPAQADAVLTDRIGSDFEDRMRELYPAPAPPPPAEDEDGGKAEKATGQEPTIASLMSEAAGGGRRTSSLSRSRGNVFLVDRNANRVLWSTYLRPRSTRPDELNRAADEIIDRLDSAAGKQLRRLRKDEARSSAQK